MVIAKWGRIVNIASIAGSGRRAVYLRILREQTRRDRIHSGDCGGVRGTGVTCNAICPGYTETEMMRSAIAKIIASSPARPKKARKKTLAGMNPEGRIDTVEEVAEASIGLIVGEPPESRSSSLEAWKRERLARRVLYIGLACTLPAMAADQTWSADPRHSSANFTVTHLAISQVPGSFRSRARRVVVPEGSNIPDQRDRVARSKRRRYACRRSRQRPQIGALLRCCYLSARWSSSRRRSAQPMLRDFARVGDLTMRGQTHPVTLTCAQPRPHDPIRAMHQHPALIPARHDRPAPNGE